MKNSIQECIKVILIRLIGGFFWQIENCEEKMNGNVQRRRTDECWQDAASEVLYKMRRLKNGRRKFSLGEKRIFFLLVIFFLEWKNNLIINPEWILTQWHKGESAKPAANQPLTGVSIEWFIHICRMFEMEVEIRLRNTYMLSEYVILNARKKINKGKNSWNTICGQRQLLWLQKFLCTTKQSSVVQYTDNSRSQRIYYLSMMVNWWIIYIYLWSHIHNNQIKYDNNMVHGWMANGYPVSAEWLGMAWQGMAWQSMALAKHE